MSYFRAITAICLMLACISCKENKSSGAGDKTHQYAADTASINSMNRLAYSLLVKNPDSAIVYVNKTFQQSTEINYGLGKGEALYCLGAAFFYKYQYDTALTFHHKALQIFEEINSKEGMAKTYYALSYNYSLLQNMPKSLECMTRSKKLMEEQNEYGKVCQCIDGMIYYHKQMNNLKAIDTLISELIANASKIKDKMRLAKSYIVLGNHYYEQAYMNLAIEAFYKALKAAEESGDSVVIASAMGRIALSHQLLREYKTAVDYYLKQEAILKVLNDHYELSNTYEGLGEAYNSLKKYSMALKYHLKSLAIREKMDYPLAINYSLLDIGYTYYLMNDSSELALKHLNRALRIDKEINNLSGETSCYMIMGKIYARKKNYALAIDLLEKSLAMAQKYRYTDAIIEASGALSKLYSERGNFAKAYSNMLIFNEVNDSIISGDNFKRITQLEMQHSFDQKKNEIELGHLKEKLMFETELKRNKLIRNYTLLIGALVAAFGAFLFYSYRKSRKADKEKEALLKEIHHRVKNNLMVISSLLNLQSGSITDDNTKSAVKESQSRVKSMALIHQLLYQSELFTSIDFAQYLGQLMASLESAYCRPGMNIKYIIKADAVKLDIDTAIPLGLITNELATNAYKYAFIDSTDGTIEINLNKTADHKYILRISDNGKGFPKDFDLESSSTLGLKLVKILSKQIKAKLTYDFTHGTEFKVVFAENV